jgi:hypothetical protein
LIGTSEQAFSDAWFQVIILFHHNIKSNILKRFKQVFTLNPKRSTVVPGRPFGGVSVAE